MKLFPRACDDWVFPIKDDFTQGTFWDDVGSQHGRSMLEHPTQRHGLGFGCMGLFWGENKKTKLKLLPAGKYHPRFSTSHLLRI